MSVTKSPWPSLDLILFGSAIAIGIFGAWIGLGTSSFWIDELTTRWIVFGDGAGDGMTGRLVTDVHPPLYYALLYAYAHLVGASDAALRSFSALTACGAVVAFILGAQGAFSLRARLFAAGVATGSAFWFYQSQNARDYGLSTLLAALILSLALALLRNDRRCGSSALWGGLAVVMLLGSLNHFYMTFLAVAVLGVLFLYLPRYRLATTVGAGLLLGFSVAYTRLIIEPYTQYSLTENWIRGDLAWNKTIVVSAVMMSVNKLAALAVALCGAVLIARLAPTVRASKPSLGGAIGWL